MRIALALSLLVLGCSSDPESPVVAALADTGPEVLPCDVCVAGKLEWGQNALFKQYPVSSISCSSYERRLASGAVRCTTMLDRCHGQPLDRIAEALAHPDVKDAVARAPYLFGNDTRPVGEYVFRISVEGKLVEIGKICFEAGDCAPPGVLALVALLKEVDQAVAMTCSAAADAG